MSQAAVDEILHRIQELDKEDRLALEKRLPELADAEWRQEAQKGRAIAQDRGLDQAAIDQAIQEVRYGR